MSPLFGRRPALHPLWPLVWRSLVSGRTRHLNPHDAVFCNFCGTPDLTDGATSIPLGWVSRLLLAGALFFAGRWLLLYFTQAPDLSFHSLTGYWDVRIWLIEKLANLLIVLFIFYFLSALIPGEAGKGFRSAMSSIVMSGIKLFFNVIERSLRALGHLFLHAMGVGPRAKKKK